MPREKVEQATLVLMGAHAEKKGGDGPWSLDVGQLERDFSRRLSGGIKGERRGV